MRTPHPAARLSTRDLLITGLIAALASFGLACQETVSPEDTLKAFVQAVRGSDGESALALLSDEDRKALEVRARAANKAIRDKASTEPIVHAKDLIASAGFMSSYHIDSIERSEEGSDEDSLTLVLKTHTETTHDVKMIRQGGTWRVALALPPGLARP